MDCERLAKQIAAHTTAEVHKDLLYRRIYSADASIFEVVPQLVAIPKSAEEVATIATLAKESGIAITARGAATGIAGGCIGPGLIVDLSKYLRRIIAINLHDNTVTVEPGVIQNQLNDYLLPFSRRLGPDTSTGNRATIGGMVANNAAGSRSLLFGSMAEHTVACDLVLAGGKTLTLSSCDEARWQHETETSPIIAAMDHIRRTYSEEIRARFLPLRRRSSGYNLLPLINPFPLNPAQLIAGSEGTLGIATCITLSLSPLLGPSLLTLIGYHDIASAMNDVTTILQEKPYSLELIDHHITAAAKVSWLPGDPKYILIVETKAPITATFGSARATLTTQRDIANVKAVREKGLGLLMSQRSYQRAVAFIEDIAVPPEQLATFMPPFLAMLQRFGKEAGIYGHAGAGCLHIRPYLNLNEQADREIIPAIQKETAALLLGNGGALSGEHGDGLIRSWLNETMYGQDIYRAFRQLKHAFDPDNLMNPGKIVNAPLPLDAIKRGKPQIDLDSNLALSVDLCNGNGLCRKEEGVMCPSYQVTKDEFDTTRARARALSFALRSDNPAEALASDDIHKVMDLCLECKGCKTECPSSIDMASMKSEALHRRHLRYGVPLKTRLVGSLATLLSWASRWPALANAVAKSGLPNLLLGFSMKRSLPRIAKTRFSKLFDTLPQPPLQKSVALFVDTYTEFTEPEIGTAAVRVLNALGYRVTLIPYRCCGRPLISKGLKDAAKQAAAKLHDLPDNMPIIGLEPSCLFTLLDDHGIKSAILFDSFLADHIDNGRLPLPFPQLKKEVLIHTHCHQKASPFRADTRRVLEAIPGLTVKEINSGCCGMAGSFGYESEHYDLSMKIGELILLPAVRASAAPFIVADGISCRTQIAHGTDKRAQHLALLLDQFVYVYRKHTELT